MRISSTYTSVNYTQVAQTRPTFQGRGSNPSAAKQIIESGRAAVQEPGKGSRIDVRG